MIVIKLILYFILGFLGVGLPTLRTMKVVDGEHLTVIPISLLSSANLYLFTILVANRDYTFMIVNSLGACLAVSLLAYRRKV